MTEKLIEAAIIIALMAVAYLLAIVIHEFGHLCMGALCGYSFVSFRIGPIEIVSETGHLKVSVKRIPGTLGQCIMMPPDSKEPEKVPAIPYHLGGGLFNLLTALTALLIIIVSKYYYLKVFCVLIGLFSFALAALNLIPGIISAPNDGYNAKLCHKSPADRNAIYHMLRISGNLTQSPGDIPDSEFSYSEEGAYAPIMAFLKGYHYLDRGDVSAAENLFEKCADKEKNSMAYYRIEACKELLFCRLIRNASAEEIAALYDTELIDYLEKSKKNSLGSARVLYAYYTLYAKDRVKADEERQRTDLIIRSVCPAEAKMEKKLIDMVQGESICNADCSVH
jgi:hypothetical protein